MEEDEDGDEVAEGEMESDSDTPAAISKGKPETSKYFRSYKYDTSKSELSLFSKTGKKVSFLDVPEEVFSSMTNAPVFDIFFRFSLMDVHESKPDAREYIIDLND